MATLCKDESLKILDGSPARPRQVWFGLHDHSFGLPGIYVYDIPMTLREFSGVTNGIIDCDRKYVHIYIYIHHIYIYIHYIYTSYIYIYMYVCVYVYVCIVYIYIYIYVCICGEHSKRSFAKFINM